MLGWDRYGFHKKCADRCYAKLMFLHPVGYAGHVVHSGASGVRNVKALISGPGGPDAVSIKSVPVHVTVNLCFYIQCDLLVT
jgi:hypothetical protein